MNKEKWNLLPPDVQKVIEAVNVEWIEKTGKGWDEIDKEGREFTLARVIRSSRCPGKKTKNGPSWSGRSWMNTWPT